MCGFSTVTWSKEEYLNLETTLDTSNLESRNSFENLEIHLEFRNLEFDNSLQLRNVFSYI